MLPLIIFIIVHSIAYNGICRMNYYKIRGEDVLYNPMWATTAIGSAIMRWYMFLALPLACLNGLLMLGWIGLILAGVGTFVCQILVQIITYHIIRIRSVTQFTLFGFIGFIWTIINIFSY
jgi:hypothetical protein